MSPVEIKEKVLLLKERLTSIATHGELYEKYAGSLAIITALDNVDEFIFILNNIINKQSQAFQKKDLARNMLMCNYYWEVLNGLDKVYRK